MKLIIVKPIEFDIEFPFFYKESKPCGDGKYVDIYHKLEEKKETSLFVYGKCKEGTINDFSIGITEYKEGLQTAIDNRLLFYHIKPNDCILSNEKEFNQIKENLKKQLEHL